MRLLSGLVGNLALPPLALAFVALLCLAAARRWRRAALAVAAVALLGQLALSTSFAAALLVESLEREVRVDTPLDPPAGAIVLLSGDVAHGRDGADPGPLTLERMRAAVVLHRRTGLPILVTGGRIGGEPEPIAAVMARIMQDDFGTSVRWVEPAARDTWENAQFSAAMLREAGIGSALLVTHAWHMPRALAVFERRGLRVAPAPVRLDRVPDWNFSHFLPAPDHAAMSWYAIREWVGRAGYLLRG